MTDLFPPQTNKFSMEHALVGASSSYPLSVDFQPAADPQVGINGFQLGLFSSDHQLSRGLWGVHRLGGCVCKRIT
jgi:hypothetical protein